MLTYMSSDSKEVVLLKYGDYVYDNIVLFAPSTDEFSDITFESILDFINAGGNLLVAVNGDISDNMRFFAASCGVEFDKKGSQVIDHFAHEDSLDNG